jgi:hypothetical protein
MGALRSVRFHGDTLAGDALTVFVDVRTRYDRFLRVDFVVSAGEERRCEGEMTLALVLDGDPGGALPGAPETSESPGAGPIIGA